MNHKRFSRLTVTLFFLFPILSTGGDMDAHTITAFEQALTSSALNAEIPDEHDIYAPLLGSWDVDVVDYGTDGAGVRSRGEWHFARVLEGRAIQDVWIVPPRSEPRNATRKNNRYGSSIRTYDGERKRWNVIWVNPVAGAENRLIGRRDEKDIVHLGRQANGELYRWTFTDITSDSFTWRGEASVNEGASWRLEAEFFARRKRAPHGHNREILWRSPDGDRLEHVSLTQRAEGYLAEGLILRHHDNRDLRFLYRISVDERWKTRELHLTQLGEKERRFVLYSDGEGNWRAENGAILPALRGCHDVDLQASPFTNTLAIRRLALPVGESQEICVVFVNLPSLAATAAKQRYTRIEEHKYRYEGLESEFVAELPTDDGGLLIEYPGYFRRAWAR